VGQGLDHLNNGALGLAAHHQIYLRETFHCFWRGSGGLGAAEDYL
jgi:hypothetical protein